MSAHTPGPWFYEMSVDGGGPIYVGKRTDKATGIDNGVVALVSYKIHSHKSSQFCFTGRQGIANARLIAAAPELLRALKRLVSATSDEDRDCEAVADAEKVISEAEGDLEK